MIRPRSQKIFDLLLDSYVEPCVDCSSGDCNMCEGRTVDHATEEHVPCPCRAAGHEQLEDA